MPEGDTVHRVAARLRAGLEGHDLTHLFVRGRGTVTELEGHPITAVEVRGKHLLIHLGTSWTLRIHLGMKGTWRKRPAGVARGPDATARLEAGPMAWECRRAYQAELIRRRDVAHHPRLTRLGPDVVADPPDLDEMVRRASLAPHGVREIGNVLLDQRIASGIGNVYKSEVLFLESVHPRRLTASLDAPGLHRLYSRAHDLMAHNLRTRRRETVPLRQRPAPASARLWTYRRRGEPCLRCDDTVRRIVQEGRSTYFCPTCQAPNGQADTQGAERA